MGSNTNRRDFLKRLSGQAGKTTTLLTADGQLVEVDIAHINSANKKKVSNKEIKAWTNQIRTKEEGDGEG